MCSDLNPATLSALQHIFDDAVDSHRTAGVSWAIVGGYGSTDALLATGAAGHRHLINGTPAPDDDAPMDEATISRIASMSKSFTAAAILRLRDEGKLSLDEPLATYVPEAAGITPASADTRPVTLREALTMSAGFVTDNPWGDRQEAMTIDEFADMLSRDLGYVHIPGTGFEYSNTGYALLGRVIDNVSGMPYTQYIREQFLQPLGMTHTGYSRDELPSEAADLVATGHRLADREDATKFEAEPFDAPGVYGAMAGLYSTVGDVAAWVRFLAAANRPVKAGSPVESSRLHPASRRDMQQVHRLQLTPAKDGAFPVIRGYGMGLVVENHPDLGEIISHSGGYPGYGSFMAWHRASGVGVIVLANSKYAPAIELGMKALRTVRSRSSLMASTPTTPAPRTREAAEAILQWLRGGDDSLADAWFADNMDPDISRDERRRRLSKALEKTGLTAASLEALTPDNARVVTPYELVWSLSTPDPARHGRLDIELLMDPRKDCLVQSVTARVHPPTQR